ncbi:alpha-1,2-fucosyltransferase [Flexibacterium corallicola]|uniref:alpha-1,2-fucosyltransferase n=1 Tax=Flexibacterium corallicola TaxID=3037259 RepID=UPI00286F46F2|nr:alpha-1,2-fucosyltransferase [Pseudovibrio sp. M1P-2-3]
MKEPHQLPLNSPPLYVDGFFQCFTHARAIKQELLTDLTLKVGLSESRLNFLELAKRDNSIAMHIRRGDYLNAQFLQNFGQCSNTYYYNAISKLRDQVGSSPLLVFSDDPQYAKDTYGHFPNIYIIPNFNDQNDEQDLYLMQQCNHTIMANSSFSWWAAFMNTQKNQQVIAPKRWFKNRSVDENNLLPPNWTRLETFTQKVTQTSDIW